MLQDDDAAPITTEAGAVKRTGIAEREDRYSDACRISQRGMQQDLRVEVRGLWLSADCRGDLVDRGADRLSVAGKPRRKVRRGAQHDVGEALGVAGIGVETIRCGGARNLESSGCCEGWYWIRRQQFLDWHDEQAGDTLGSCEHLCLARGPGQIP